MSNAGKEGQEIAADDFCRRFSMRAANLMWLLGAGASAAAGIPTAYDMVWDFKLRLYVSQRRISTKAIDFASQAIRAQVQAHIDASGSLPACDAPDEYAALFEAVYPAEGDRQTYLEAKIAGAKPSYGHYALATMMRANLTKLVWTTNFDPLIADACAKIYDGTGALTTGTLDAADLAIQRIGQNRWPIEIKLHGDFRSRRLKNTNDELRMQDALLRRALVEACHRYGLVIVGYSGRDNSVMETLEEALGKEGSFPQGLFWLHRGEDQPHARVLELLMLASKRGVDAALVRIQNFDELTRDLIRLLSGTDTTALEEFGKTRERRTAAPEPQGRQSWPMVRLNAIPVIRAPTICRRIDCNIGGTAEVVAAVEKAAVEVISSRVQAGVLAFGSDADVKKAFEPHAIAQFDVYSLQPKRLSRDTGERSLLRHALSCAIAKNRGLDCIRRRRGDLFAPRDLSASSWKSLAKLVGSLSGVLDEESNLTWREGISTSLDWAQGQLWLIIEPRTVFSGVTDENRTRCTDFARERSVKRYNRVLNDLVEFWVRVLSDRESDMRAIGTGEGVDAVFTLSQVTAFSRRVGA